jgi:VWFA-related protein
LIDTSKPATKDALDGVLDFLSSAVRKDDRILVANFSDQFDHGEPTRDPVQAKREINNLRWGGGSALYDAIVQLPAVLIRLRTESERQIVILLSDGNDSSSKASLKDAIAAAQANQIIVFAIDTRFITRIRAGHEEEERLAEESGGECFEFVSKKELGNAFKKIQAAIENQYFLTYVPLPVPHAKIRVRADDLRVLAPRQR